MRIGLALESGFERFFVKAELLSIKDDIEFSDFASHSECMSYLESNQIDAYVATSANIPERENLDWFSFSWYEDYPFNVIYKVSDIKISSVMAPLNIKNSLFGPTLSHYFSGEVEKAMYMFTEGNIGSILVPGRLSHYLEPKYPYYLSDRRIKKQILPLKKSIFEKEFALIFKKGNKGAERLLPYFLKVLTFVGGGVGEPELCSLAGFEALKTADVCLYDSLVNHRLLNYLPNDAITINVGKRWHSHSVEQPTINELLVKYVKKGFRVVRLKCGDPSIFGRLAEEIAYLEEHKIPYRVIPGISSLNAMAAQTGIILTRRGINRGFCVMSPIKHGGGFTSIGAKERAKLPMVFFMGVRVIAKITKELLKEGFPPDTEASVAFSVGSEDETVIKGTLSTISDYIQPYLKDSSVKPGIFVVGSVASSEFKDNSLLKNKKVLIATESTPASKISARLRDFGAFVVLYSPPAIDESQFYEAFAKLDKVDVLAFSEFTTMRLFVEKFIEFFSDISLLPIITTTPEISRLANNLGVETLSSDSLKNKKITYLYIRKNMEFSKSLMRKNTITEIICNRKPFLGKMGRCDIAIFLDCDSFWSFVETHGFELLRTCKIWVPDNKEIVWFLNDRDIGCELLPDNFNTGCTDIRFLFGASEPTDRKTVVLN